MERMLSEGYVIVSNTDNLLISSFVGVVTAGIYSNYFLVIGSIRQILEQAIQGVSASVGNLEAMQEKDRFNDIFDKLFFIGYCLFGVAGICLYELLNPFVEISFGTKNLMISVIIPVYNAEKYLNQTIDSILASNADIVVGNYARLWNGNL